MAEYVRVPLGRTIENAVFAVFLALLAGLLALGAAFKFFPNRNSLIFATLGTAIVVSWLLVFALKQSRARAQVRQQSHQAAQKAQKAALERKNGAAPPKQVPRTPTATEVAEIADARGSSDEGSWISDREMEQIAESAARRAQEELNSELRVSGVNLTDQQRQAILHARGARYSTEEVNRLHAQRQLNQELAELHEAVEQLGEINARTDERRHRETVGAIENSTQFGRSRRFKQDHPFLAGLLGSENVDKLTGQGWWKG